MTREAPPGRRFAAGAALPGLLLAVLAGVLVGLGVHTFRYADGAAYLSDDPRACVNCHVMQEQYDAWQKSGHHAAASCNDCHVPADPLGRWTSKAVHGWRHSKAFTLQDFHEPIRIRDDDLRLVEQNCLRCHEPLVADVAGSHDESRCTSCHRGVGHGPWR